MHQRCTRQAALPVRTGTRADGAQQLGGVDVALANAGIGIMEDTDPRRAFHDPLDVKLVGAWNTVHAAAPLMIKQGRGGAVVLTSSASGLTGRGGDGAGGTDVTAAVAFLASGEARYITGYANGEAGRRTVRFSGEHGMSGRSRSIRDKALRAGPRGSVVDGAHGHRIALRGRIDVGGRSNVDGVAFDRTVGREPEHLVGVGKHTGRLSGGTRHGVCSPSKAVVWLGRMRVPHARACERRLTRACSRSERPCPRTADEQRQAVP